VGEWHGASKQTSNAINTAIIARYDARNRFISAIR